MSYFAIFTHPTVGSATTTLTKINYVFFCFQGYSFVAPSILFNKNVVMGDVLDAEAHIDRPGSATVQRSAMLKVQNIKLKKRSF